MSPPVDPVPRTQLPESPPAEADAWARLDPYIRPDLAHSALLTIDVQADFLAGGAAPLPGADQVLPAIGRVADAFRTADLPIVHVVRLYEGADVDLVRRHAIITGTPLVRPGSPGSRLASAIIPPDAPELDARALLEGEVQQLGPQEVVLFKPRWSAFYRTPLRDHLTELGVSTVVVTGLNYPNCPRATISDASARDLRIVVTSDALSGLVDLHLTEAMAIGTVPATAAAVVARLQQLGRTPT